jgi:hypothetical protein
VVLGPGVKLIAVASTNKAVNSCQFMVADFIVETRTVPLQLGVQIFKLYRSLCPHTCAARASGRECVHGGGV